MTSIVHVPRSIAPIWLAALFVIILPCWEAVAEDCCTNPITDRSACAFIRPHGGYDPPKNGCGPQNNPTLSKAGNFVGGFGLANFVPACNGHDICYGTCDPTENLSTKVGCDQTFLLGMQQQCASTYSTLPVAPTQVAALYECFVLAGEFYSIVALLGGVAYQEGQNAACDCCAAPPCVNGVCQGLTCVECPKGETQCGDLPGNCVNTANDPNNCGLCLRACSSDQVCQNGSCTCPSGESDCAGTCCPTGDCQNGSCTPCPAGQVMCPDGACHTGSCDCTPPCPADQTCQNGTCAPSSSCTGTCPNGQACSGGTCHTIVGSCLMLHPPVMPPTCSDSFATDTTAKLVCVGPIAQWSDLPCPTANRVGSCDEEIYILRFYQDTSAPRGNCFDDTSCSGPVAGQCPGAPIVDIHHSCVAGLCDQRETPEQDSYVCCFDCTSNPQNPFPGVCSAWTPN